MSSFAMSVKDEKRGLKTYTTIKELSWEKLWEALTIYDGRGSRRDRKKFYIYMAASENKKRVNIQR